MILVMFFQRCQVVVVIVVVMVVVVVIVLVVKISENDIRKQ
jgi:hypothetical protein